MIVRRLARWLRTSEASDEGAILVLAAFLMILIFAAAALAIDITTKSQHRSDSVDHLRRRGSRRCIAAP